MLSWMIREKLIHCFSLREHDLFVYEGQSHIVIKIDIVIVGLNLETGSYVELNPNTTVYKAQRVLCEVNN